METVKHILWENHITRNIMFLLSYIKNVIIRHIGYRIKMFFRIKTDLYPNYKAITQYKNAHSGERCFILATGPSLTLEDVKMLKNEITFGMNSICLLFDQLGWETTYYGVQDKGVFEKLKGYYSNMNETTLFIGDGIKSDECSCVKYIPFALNYLNHKHSYDKLKTRFSCDAEKCVYDGYTITYSLMQIAAYMGFTEIYLLGNDCSYSSDVTKQHFADFGHYDKSTLTARERILYAYQYAYEYLKNTNIKIYNATRGGELEIFPRVRLEDVLANEKE